MRRGPGDVGAKRQRVLFGVDRLERHVADLTVELLRLVRARDDVSRETQCETAHVKRLKSWLELYLELQRSDFELGELTKEVSDGTPEK